MTTEPITAIHLAALRRADRFVFRHVNNKSRIEAIKVNGPSEKDPFAQDVVLDVPCNFVLDDYSEDDAHVSYDAAVSGTFTAFDMLYSYYDEWRTTVSMLRAGDELTLVWKRDAMSCGYMKDAKLHGDRLGLLVTRGEKKLHFHVSESISEDNSARMVKVSWASTRAAAQAKAA